MASERRRSESGKYIVLTLRAFEDDGVFASECIELQTASQGDTPDEAIANAYDAALVYLDTIADLGEQDRVLKERGIRILHSKPKQIDLHTSVQPGDVVKALVHPLRSPAAISA
jgi:predicted RNase H-like HicB family nuclease